VIIWVTWPISWSFSSVSSVLICSQAEPGSREREVRAGHWLELQDLGVELRAPLEVGNVQGHMIEL